MASQNGHAPVGELRLNAGAVVDRPRPSDGVVAGHFASQNGHASVVELLLRAGADPLRLVNDGMMPLDIAMQNNHAEM